MSQAFFLGNKTFRLEVDESTKSAKVVQTNIKAFTAEQIDHAVKNGFYKDGPPPTIEWATIPNTNLRGKRWMDIQGALPDEFKEILNDDGSKAIFRQALGVDSPNEGKDQNNDFLVTGQATEGQGLRADANRGQKPKYFFAYYPIAEVGGYDYLQIVCKEHKADEMIANLTKDYDVTNVENPRNSDENITEFEQKYEDRGIKLSNPMEIKRATSSSTSNDRWIK